MTVIHAFTVIKHVCIIAVIHACTIGRVKASAVTTINAAREYVASNYRSLDSHLKRMDKH